MSEAPTNAVIFAEPDGYDVGIERLMGRQAAGHGFLRAAVAARGDRPIHGLTASAKSAETFRSLVQAIDPAAAFEWIPPGRPDRIADLGVLYVPGPTLGPQARLRQRAGVARFSLCGVTHTTASLRAMDDLVDLRREAVMPWDAVICTSKSVVETVRRVHETEADYLRWRFGAEANPPSPQLPLIPLGVHCDDFAIAETAKAEARRRLGLAPDDVAALFVGRLLFHAKAHPYPMLRGLQLAAERTGKRLVLILCGWFPNATIEAAFRAGATAFAPDVRMIVLDGRQAPQRQSAWAAADFFMSLADSIQETFGLTPIEAMAASLPVIVSDWNGYRDTVRHQIDGFLVPTLAPAAGMGQHLADAHGAGAVSYDRYCWATASTTAVDARAVVEAITALVQDPALRRRQGDAGRQRARALFDWRVIYGQYQALWTDLDARRRAANGDPGLQGWIARAPRVAAARLDPYDAFGHYPSATIGPASRLRRADNAVTADLAAVLAHPLMNELTVGRPLITALLAELQAGEITLAQAAERLTVDRGTAARAAGVLAKLGLLEAVPPDGASGGAG